MNEIVRRVMEKYLRLAENNLKLAEDQVDAIAEKLEQATDLRDTIQAEVKAFREQLKEENDQPQPGATRPTHWGRYSGLARIPQPAHPA